MNMDGLIPRLALALAIGLLIGLERGWRERDAPAGSRTAGIRTYGISGLLGGVMAAVASALNAPLVFIAGFLGFGLIFGWFKTREAERDDEFSVTGVIAGLCVFALGGLAVSGSYEAAAATGAALAAVLASRELLHRLLQRLSWVELRSAIMLAVMTTVGLPLLPNRPIDPWGGLNPWEVWFFTVLTAGISYLGYIAIRVLGNSKGLLVSALTGSLVSSTAVSLAFARMAKAGADARPLAGVAMLAAMVSILRVIVLVLLIRPAMLGIFGPAALAAAGTFALGGLFFTLRRRDDATDETPPAQNPFELGTLLVFAALFAIVSTGSAALVLHLGSGSLVGTSAVSGFVDVDVAVLNALRSVGQAIAPDLIGLAILAALASNAVGRLILAASAGTRTYGMLLALVTAAALVAGYASYVLAPKSF
ncbi:MAG: MgtC/SapB family protein [Parvibaculaceae bacterium]